MDFFFFFSFFFQKHGGKFKSVESNLWMAFLNFPSSYTSLLTFRVKCDKTRREYSILKDISKKMMWRILCQLFWLLKKKDSKIWKKCDLYFFQLPTTARDCLHQSWFFPFLKLYVAAAIVSHLSCLQWNISRYTTKVRVLPDVSLLSPL